jgi:thymidylate synthase
VDRPYVIIEETFQEAWLSASRKLVGDGYARNNLIVQIENPLVINTIFHERVKTFASAHGRLSPKTVAYTIFPHKLYQRVGNADDLYAAYNRPRGLYDKIKTSWGTYFRRMTRYEHDGTHENQLRNIVEAMRNRTKVYRAAYTIIIQKPGGETIRPRGGPCLNYLAIQLDGAGSVGLLAVYRNHDFFERSYGNYWGLCNLLGFIAKESELDCGPLTCISSRAYIDGPKTRFKSYLETVGD